MSILTAVNSKFNITEVSIVEHTIIEEVLAPTSEDYIAYSAIKSKNNDVINTDPNLWITTNINTDVGINSKKWEFKMNEPTYVEPAYFQQVYEILEKAGKI